MMAEPRFFDLSALLGMSMGDLHLNTPVGKYDIGYDLYACLRERFMHGQIQTEFSKMRTWIAANPSRVRDRDMEDWPRFVSSWMNNCEPELRKSGFVDRVTDISWATKRC